MSKPLQTAASNKLRQWISQTPGLGTLARWTYRRLYPVTAIDSQQFWIDRYRSGGNSGFGSYGKLAEFKATFLNGFVVTHRVDTVIEFGCGDGNQLTYAKYPRYHGYDVSPDAVNLCRQKFAGDATKQFSLVDDYDGRTADLVLSLDVIFHLVEDHVFESYMHRLFKATHRYVAVYSTNFSQPPDRTDAHVRHRRFSDWIATHYPAFELIEHVPNPYANDFKQGSRAEFYIYQITPRASVLGAEQAETSTGRSL